VIKKAPILYISLWP